MPNVWDAMQKHQAEQGAAPASGPAQDDRPAQSPGEHEGNGKRADVPAAAAQDQGVLPAAATATPVPSASHPAAAAGEATRPAPGGEAYGAELVAHHDRGGSITEQYRSLRTNLLARYPDERFCLTVTSAEAGEGKTITSLNLALVLAERQDHTVVVVDGDLRKRRVAHLLGISQSPGVAEVLRGECRVFDAVRPTAYPNLMVVTAGDIRGGEVGGLIGRPELHDLVLDLRRAYDCVIIDAPPVNVASDAGIISRSAGESLVVFRMNHTHRESTDKAIRLLRAADVKVIGMVLTHQKYYIPNYLYRYS